MILGIDGSNIKTGGGLTHLLELLNHAKPDIYNIEKIIIWGGGQLKVLPQFEWLDIRIEKLLINSNPLKENYWRYFVLPKLAQIECDLLFSPGGLFYDKRIPYVSMSQNMLVFDSVERNRFKGSKSWFRYLLLNAVQKKSFKNANGVIFISSYAKNSITKIVNVKQSEVIYHGVNQRFSCRPRKQQSIKKYSIERPYKILYVSIINLYKHQWVLVEAIAKLRIEDNLPVELILAGPSYEKAYSKLKKSIENIKGDNSFIKYLGKVDYQEIQNLYKSADLFAFSSSCENMPNILIEAMSAGLPICSSNYGPMPEILKNAGVYYNPLSVTSVYNVIKSVLMDEFQREEISKKAFELCKNYTWQTCSNKTLNFLSGIYRNQKR